MPKQIIWQETKRKGIALGPQLFQKAIEQAAGKGLEFAVQHAKLFSGSRTLSGSQGGEGGISGRIQKSSNKLKLIIGASAKNKISGFDFAIVREAGSGIYGPNKKRIISKRAKFMVWLKDKRPNPLTKEGWKQERAKDNIIIARSVKGQKGYFYLKNALKYTLEKLPTIIDYEVNLINQEVK